MTSPTYSPGAGASDANTPALEGDYREFPGVRVNHKGIDILVDEQNEQTEGCSGRSTPSSCDDRNTQWSRDDRSTPLTEDDRSTPLTGYELEVRDAVEKHNEWQARQNLSALGFPPCCPPAMRYPVGRSDAYLLPEPDRGATRWFMSTELKPRDQPPEQPRGTRPDFFFPNPVVQQLLEWDHGFQPYQTKVRRDLGLRWQQKRVNKTLAYFKIPYSFTLNPRPFLQSVRVNQAEYLTWQYNRYESRQLRLLLGLYGSEEKAERVVRGLRTLGGLFPWIVQMIRDRHDQFHSVAGSIGGGEEEETIVLTGTAVTYEDALLLGDDDLVGEDLFTGPSKKRKRGDDYDDDGDDFYDDFYNDVYDDEDDDDEDVVYEVASGLGKDRVTRSIAHLRQIINYLYIDDRGQSVMYTCRRGPWCRWPGGVPFAKVDEEGSVPLLSDS